MARDRNDWGNVFVASEFMKVSIDLSAIRGTQWSQYILRFVLGGTATVGAGLIAKAFGPVFGGLFLAFPAIFPASATLIAQRERHKKARKGLDGKRRGREAAALDASGATLGAVALMGFAALVWRTVLTRGPVFALVISALTWLGVSVGLWWLSEQDSRLRRVHRCDDTDDRIGRL